MHCNVIAHRSHAGHSQTLADTPTVLSSGRLWGGVSRRAWPTTSTSRRVRGRSRHWRPRGVSCVDRSWSIGCVTVGWPPARGPGLPVRRHPTVAAVRVPGSVMPGCFDEQPPGMTVAGLGDPALRTCRARGVLSGHQPQIRPDGPTGEPMPVADLDGQPERGERGDTTHTRAGSPPR